MDIGLQIKKFREQQKISQEELALKIFVSKKIKTKKRKNRCQIGVKPKKNDNFKSEKCLQTIDFTGFAKK